MKKLLLILSLLPTLLPVNAKTKKIDADPINVAFMLSQDTDSASIACTCLYYGYEAQSGKNGYSIFKHPNGSVIRYTFKDATESQPYPQVEVKASKGFRDLDETLTDLKFRKQGNAYIHNVGQHAKTETRCRHLPGGFLSFQRQKLETKD